MWRVALVMMLLAGCASAPKATQPDLSSWQQINASVPPELAGKAQLPREWR